MSPPWYRVQVAAELPGQRGGLARVALLPAAPADPAALCGDNDEACCLLWPAQPVPQARCLQRGRPIALCGHGLLAGAQIWLEQHAGPQVVFDGGGFRITASHDGIRPWLTLARPHCLDTALASLPGWFDLPPTHAAIAGPATGYRILAWPDGTDLGRLRADIPRIREHDGRALIITAAQADGSVALRYFAPQYGNDEDAATGSACTVLADYWQRRSGRLRLRLRQQSAAGALFHTRLDAFTVSLGGLAVVESRGTGS